MKPISVILAGLLMASLASFGYAQSLADLAKKEKERRQAVKGDTKVITNEQAAKYRSGPVTTTTPSAVPAADAQKPVGDVPAAKEKPLSDEPVDFQGRPESFWKQTFADARRKVSEFENEANVIILKLNDLQNRFYRESDGYQQQAIQREIQKTFYQQDLNKDNLAKAKDALTDLEKEARKSGALPGWIR
jgi:hypothetical protein